MSASETGFSPIIESYRACDTEKLFLAHRAIGHMTHLIGGLPLRIGQRVREYAVVYLVCHDCRYLLVLLDSVTKQATMP